MEIGWLYSDLGQDLGAEERRHRGLLRPAGRRDADAVVGVVSFCVHLFSMGYMHGDKRYHIFFANISLFTFAMLGLVLSDNMLFLFVFWEIMGLMSYLLIGHFSHDPEPALLRIKLGRLGLQEGLPDHARGGHVCLFIGI